MTITSKFPSRCARCNGAIPVGTRITWSPGVRPTHLDACPVVAPQVAVVQDAKPIADFLTAAVARGLRFPKARFLAADGVREIRLSLAGAGAKVPGSIQVLLADVWVGRIEPSGRVMGKLAYDAALLGTLAAIAADPAAAAKAYGALMCRCSFCNKALTDAGSVEVGYGPICAKAYNLPHAPQGTPAVTVIPAIA